MNIVYWLSGAALFIIAAFSCYTDIKYGKISNKVIFFGAVFAVALYAFLLLHNFLFVGKDSNVDYVLKMATNGSLSLAVGFFLWKFNFWSAGDAKLFAIYSAIMPLEAYSNGAVQNYLSFNLLINLFFPILIVLLLKAVLFAGKKVWQGLKEKTLADDMKKRMTIKGLGKSALAIVKNFTDFVFMYISFSWIFSFLGIFTGGRLSLDPFLMFFLMLYLSSQLSKLKEKFKFVNAIIYAIVPLDIVYLLIMRNFRTIKSILFFSAIFMILIGLTRHILRLYVEVGETQRVKVRDLKEGMVIYYDEISAIRNLAEERGQKDKFDFLGQGGVKDDQIRIITQLFEGREETIFRVYNSFPFAPFLSLSAILTFVTKASFLNLLAALMKLNK